ncbi:uncharacterized protein LOC116350536 [Contarinia nasturtii]|uniref:uncharacterized protein LOC116350536 n=1 Tax=Contarinia nasturtii TaxID=265458 RepID=UPI0012D4A4A2|nr:uncharacterized protein LOC116350536 [Contarinia nasturtii]
MLTNAQIVSNHQPAPVYSAPVQQQPTPEVARSNRKHSTESEFSTLYVTSTKPIEGDKIIDYFNQFGEVGVSWYSINNLQYGRVFLDMDDDTKVSLLRMNHRIENVDLKVTEEDVHYPTDYSKEVKQDAPILNIFNDKCFREVFKYLNDKDLCNAANVCVHFNKQAKAAFPQEKKRFIGGDAYEWGRDDSLLHNFGSLITSLSIDSQTGALKSAVRFCTSLKHLEIRRIGIKEDWIKEMCPFFAKLESISFEECYPLDNIKELISGASQLKHLQIRSRAKDIEFPSKVFRLIGEHMPYLEKLDLELKDMFINSSNYQTDIQYLSDLNSLKVLKIKSSHSFDIGRLIKAFVGNKTPLEKLVLMNANIDEDCIGSICQIKSLMDIQLENYNEYKTEHMLKLVEDMPQLRSLEISNGCRDSHQFKNIEFFRKMLTNAQIVSNQ